MTYGQSGQRGQEPGNSPPQPRYTQQDDTQGLERFSQRRDGQRRQQQGGGDGRWQPPEWHYGQQWNEQQQRYDQGTGRQGYAPTQYQSQQGQPGYGQPFPPPQPPYGPPQQPYRSPQPPQRGKSWPARHKALTGILAFVALIIIITAANSGRSPSSPGSGTTAGMTKAASATATGAPSQHAAHAAATVQKTPPKRTQTTSAPSRVPASSVSAQTTPAAVVAPPASAAPASCHPLTNGGNCYEPGEYCRDADQGASGVAGDGEAITCEDNDGWRWEPS